MLERPDGSTSTTIGWVLVVIGIIAAFFAASTESMTSFVLCVVLSNLGIGLGVLLLSLGYLVRAIWFLPGREIADPAPAYARPSPHENSRNAEEAQCDFCGKVIAAPAQPCSAFSDNQLPSLGPRVTNPECKSELKFRGYLSE